MGDCIVGSKHGADAPYSRRELRTLIQLNSITDTGASPETTSSGTVLPRNVSLEEGLLAMNVLDFATKTVGCCMRGLNEYFMLDAGDALTGNLLQRIREADYNRIPVFENRRDC